MKNKKIVLSLTLAIAMFASLLIVTASAHTAAAPQQNILVAGSPQISRATPEQYSDPAWRAANLNIIGDIRTWNDGTNLHITYTTYSGPWVIMQTHLAIYVSDDAHSYRYFPMTLSGNPKQGQFPYGDESLPGVTSVEYVIPLSEITGLHTGANVGDRLIIAAHAIVYNPVTGCTQTAWGDCGGPTARFPGANWAVFFWYAVQ
jgi:hypothetical protein